MPRCDALSTRRSGVWPARGRAAACSPPAACSSSSSQYLDPVGRPRPADYRISDQGILNIAFGARSRRDHGELYRRARAAGARPNRRPVHMPGGGVVYVNDPDGFSVELLWMSPASDKRWGFTPAAGRRAAAGRHARGRADGADRRARADHVGGDRGPRDAWATWLGSARCAGRVDGAPEPDGRGSERLLTLPGASITEQVRGLRAADLVPLPGDQRIAVRLPPGRDPAASRRRPDRAHLADPLPAEAARHRAPAGDRRCPRLLGRVLRSGLKPHIEALRPAGRPAAATDGRVRDGVESARR